MLKRIAKHVANVIGQRGLSYRGDKHKSAYSLEDLTLDHGDILELILYIFMYIYIIQHGWHLSASTRQ